MLQRHVKRVQLGGHDAGEHGGVLSHERACSCLVFSLEDHDAERSVRRGPCQSDCPHSARLLQAYEMTVYGGRLLLCLQQHSLRPGQAYYVDPCRHVALPIRSSPSADSVAAKHGGRSFLTVFAAGEQISLYADGSPPYCQLCGGDTIAVRRQSWWWLLLVAFVLAVLNLVSNGWQFVLPGSLLFFASNALSIVLSIAALVWSLFDLLASYRTGRSVRKGIYVTSWILATGIIVVVELWTLAIARLT